MNFAALRRWHWMLIAIVGGALLGYAHQHGQEDLQYAFGNSITGQRDFENLVLGTVDGRHTFDNLHVHRQMMLDGKGATKPVYVVTGTAFLGEYEIEGGKKVAHWRPIFFATSGPYNPRNNLSQFNKRGGPDYAKQFREIKEPTVVDFLNVLSQARGITYKHAWWNEISIGWWVLASFVVVGLVWPTILNLIAFGSWRRPPQAKGLSLFGVKAHAAAVEKPAMQLDDASLQAVEQQLAQSPPGVQTVSADTPAPVRELDAAPVAPAVVGADHAAEFGAKKDDFYPTEVHSLHSPK
jgi:hypothetical protein